jgi:2,3-bisphosphoglycerate-independent phosphoglycerate mutase
LISPIRVGTVDRGKEGTVKAVLVIADGLGGRPSDRQGRSCLEAAATPTLDGLAERGALGLLDPIRNGVRPGSDTSHLSLLGYDPFAVYTGRGAFECLGIGMDVACGDICFRANFATAERTSDGLRLKDRRAGRIERGQAELAEALASIELESHPEVSFEFRPSTQHRGALVLRGPKLSRQVSENDPHETGTPIPEAEPLEADGSGAAQRTADLVNEIARRSYELWNDHPVNRERIAAGQLPANVLLLRGAADLPELPSIPSTYGIRAAVIAGGALYRGVALAAGMTSIPCPGATGGLDTDLGAKARTALDALADYDVVFVHIKGTDNAGHDRDADAKTAFIERIDAEFFAPLVAGLPMDGAHLAFTGDHTTPIDFGDHTTDPVPALFVGPNVMPDACKRFDERTAASGGLGRFAGRILPMLLGYCNWSPKFGS